MLADKDAAGAVAALAPVLRASSAPRSRPRRCTRRAGPGRAPTLPTIWPRICRDEGLEAEAEPNLGAALARARELASASPGGTLLITGSHYLLAPARARLLTWTFPWDYPE